MPFISSFSTRVQGSFEHLHVLLLANYEWVKRSFCNFCGEELFKGTIITLPPHGKLNFHRPQLSQVPLCAISSSYYFYNMVLATTFACGERKYDTTTLF